ncbi:hypothetical protein, partial [Salinibacter ruber]|uniref:hypothetical protein n=1 Tax=Salinibacter ruber TaxID=146919 RepID=UPI002073FB89
RLCGGRIQGESEWMQDIRRGPAEGAFASGASAADAPGSFAVQSEKTFHVTQGSGATLTSLAFQL